MLVLIFISNNAEGLSMSTRSVRALRRHITCTSLHGWNGDDNNNSNDMISNFFGGVASAKKKESVSSTLITPQMEEDVLATARATMDTRAVSRAVSALVDDDRIETTNENVVGLRSRNTIKGSNKLRDLAAGKVDNKSLATSSTTTNIGSSNNNNDSDNSWNTQQIAIASGATVMFLSPVVVPIVHAFLPPVIPSPSSVSFTGSALLGALAYIVALGDPTDQSNVAGNTSGALGEGVEVGGAVSRIVGRTALQTAKASVPRVRAVARAALDYDTTTATLEELKNRVDYLSRKTLELDDENQVLRYEVALFNAVEDVSSMYKLDELKELARYRGMKGYSTESKNSLLRKLVKEQVMEIDLTPYYDSIGDRL